MERERVTRRSRRLAPIATRPMPVVARSTRLEGHDAAEGLGDRLAEQLGPTAYRG
jgi:hypothetical protein